MQQARRFFLALGLLSFALAGVEPALARTAHSTHTTSKPASAKPKAGSSKTAPKPKPATARPVPADTTPPPTVENPELLVDMLSGNVLFEQNAGAPWHPASLTKLMTAYVTFQAIEDGRISLDSKVTMSVKAVNEAPARSGLKPGEQLTLKDALYVMLVKSANDMAMAIAETVGGSSDAFVAEMNATAGKLGLTRTHYDNPNGLPDAGQVTTARDLAVLAIDLRRTFPQYDPIFRTHIVTLGTVSLRTNNQLLTRFAGTTGMKTGYVCGSGLNVVATVQRGDRQLLAVVLGGSSARERDQLAAQMLSRGFAGAFTDHGKNVVNIADDVTSPVMDMSPLLCGKKAKGYVAARLKQFPYGLRGQPNFLTDKLEGTTYAATDLGPAPGTGPTAGPAVSPAAAAADEEDPAPPDQAAAPGATTPSTVQTPAPTASPALQ